MQIKALGYALEPCVSLWLVPETDVERTLLEAMWEHGRLELLNGCADGTGQGFAITNRSAEEA